MKKLFGVVCASVTPMLPDGTVDLESAASLYRHLGAMGIHSLYPNGTNGESISLTYEERCRLTDCVVRENAGKCSVYMQCGAATVTETKDNILYAKAHGADGVGIMTPVFFATDDAALEQYYDDMLDAAGDMPSYVYNIPSRTGNDVSVVLMGRLMKKHANLQGIKYSAPDLMRITGYVNCDPERHTDALIGCDNLALCCMDVGGAGWVSGPAAVFGERFVRLYDQISAGDTEDAKKTQLGIVRLGNGMAGIPEIPAIKYMLVKRGVIAHDTCRAPFRALTDAEKAALARLLAEYMKEENL